ncbi:MAG: M24 family metallopeptidase [Candidatus Dormibacteraeota bacterium]|nr:M24 family metallopeptidase [Candidatus Dormibacteraeota bacterium]
MLSAGLDAIVASGAANVTYATGYFYWPDYMIQRWMVAPGDTGAPMGARAVVYVDGRVELIVAELFAVNSDGLSVTRVLTFGKSALTLLVVGYPDAVAAQAAALSYFGMGASGIVCEARHRLTRDDVLFVDLGCKLGHVFSDTGLTLCLRTPDAGATRAYAALIDSVSAGAHAPIPGVRSARVAEVMPAQLEAPDVGDGHAEGHGLGLELRDYPIIVPSNGTRTRDGCVDVSSDLPMEPGMVSNLEASLFRSGRSFQVEQSFLVGQAGAEPLTDNSRQRPYVPPEGGD